MKEGLPMSTRVKAIAIAFFVSLTATVMLSCPPCQDEKCALGQCICVPRIPCNPPPPPGQLLQQAVNGVAEVVKDVTNTLGSAGKDAGAKITSIGGDGATIVGGVFTKAGDTVQNVGVTTATIATTGIASPTNEFITSLDKTAKTLSEIDLRHKETLENVLQHAAGTAVGVVVSAQRTAETSANDVSSLAVSTLPAPLEHTVRRISAEVIKELETKHPELAQLLRRLPTSIIYNYLRALAGNELPCDPAALFAKLHTAPQKELDNGARWGAIVSTPLVKDQGISGWTVTGCRGTALGVLERDAAYSADNIITLDLRLIRLGINGTANDVTGRFLRIEILPIGRAHAFALYHSLRQGDTVLTSGKIVQDEDARPIPNVDGPWLEIHPVDDLEVIATPTRTREATVGIAGYLLAPQRNDAARFLTYITQPGDSLPSIATRFYGTQRSSILYAANRTLLKNAATLPVGATLNVPIKLSGGIAATVPELRAYANPIGFLAKEADHTWVTNYSATPSCPNPVPDYWYSTGSCHPSGNDHAPQLLAREPANISMAECIARPNITTFDPGPPTARIVYGIDGVCHQIANRILAATPNAQPVTVKGAHGYTISRFVYGTYGTMRQWQQLQHDCHVTAAKPLASAAEVHALVEEAHVRLTAEQLATVEKEHDILQTKIHSIGEAAMAGRIKATDVATQVNEAVNSSLKHLAETLGSKNFEAIFDWRASETIELVNPEVARAVHYAR